MIPDIEITKNYILTLQCGHKKRTLAPCKVGDLMLCDHDSHPSGQYPITEIYSKLLNKNVDSIGWISMQASMHDAYDKSKSKKERKFWVKVIGGMF